MDKGKIAIIKMDQLYEDFNSNKNDVADTRKKISQFFKNNLKRNEIKCYFCDEKISGFCNSHTIPRSFLENIAFEGDLFFYNSILKNNNHLSLSKGIKNANTFKLICKKCDNEIFKNYENYGKYKSEPTPKMLSEIEMKNNLFYISKKIHENIISLYAKKDYEFKIEKNKEKIKKIFSDFKSKNDFFLEKTLKSNNDYEQHYLYIIKFFQKIFELKNEYNLYEKLNEYFNKQEKNSLIAIKEYEKEFLKSKEIYSLEKNDQYKLFYYKKLDYVVPIAFQGKIFLYYDFEGKIINDPLDFDSSYENTSINLCIFPLIDKTIIIIFTNNDNNLYDSFFKIFSEKTEEQKIEIINYILFLYTEDFLLYPKIDEKTIGEIEDFFSKAIVYDPFDEPSKEEKYKVFEKHFCLQDSKLKCIKKLPNLLSEEYRIKKE